MSSPIVVGYDPAHADPAPAESRRCTRAVTTTGAGRGGPPPPRTVHRALPRGVHLDGLAELATASNAEQS
jgi:hypothetical protein